MHHFIRVNIDAEKTLIKLQGLLFMESCIYIPPLEPHWLELGIGAVRKVGGSNPDRGTTVG